MRQALALGLLGLLAASAARLSALDPSAGLTEPTVVLVEGSHTANATVATGSVRSETTSRAGASRAFHCAASASPRRTAASHP